MSRFAPVARAMRNGQAESWHFGAVAAVTPEGGLIGHVGDSGVETFLRSAAKPFQALPLLQAGGRQRFDLEDADLALICASHGGAPQHVERAHALLARLGLDGSALGCGPHSPLDEESAKRLRQEGLEPDRLHNNCSGKHAGLLLACAALDLPTEDYLRSEHPLQKAILCTLAQFCGIARQSIGIAVDGCGVPTFRVPLVAAARAYAALADPRRAGLGQGLSEGVDEVVRAMTGAPAMVAGPGRFTTRLMEVTGGRLLGKEGHEGLYGVAVRGPVSMGIAVKIADGAGRCRDGVVLDVLRQLGSLSGAELRELAGFHRPVRRNTRDEKIGEIVADLEVIEA